MYNGVVVPVLACVLFAAVATGCNPKPKNAGQVAAQVNGREITVHELNRRLANVELKSPEAAPQVKREILDELIERELLVQRALEAKLDRDPEIMRALEQARETILAEALMNRQIGAQAEPAPAQIQSFLNAHPELFGRRRVYELVQFTVPSDALRGPFLARLDGARGAREIEHALQGAKIDYASETVRRAAEQLPMELAAKLLPTARGDIVTFTDESEAYLIYVQDFQEEPVDDQQARVNIKEYLTNVEKQQVVARMLKELRENADIRYVGEFAEAAQAETVASEPQGAPVRGGHEKTLPAHVERGVSGLVK